MPFDPNKPYEVIDQSAQQVQFDPSKPFELIETKGGEQTNEDQIRNQPEADSNRNAGREANQQEPSVGSQAQLQADVQLPAKDQGQRQRNDQASLTNEKQTQDAQGGIQGTQAGQGMESQVPAGNQEEIKPQETGVQAAFSKVRDFGAEALSSIGQSIYGAGAGVFRNEPEFLDLTSLGVKVKNPRYEESQNLVNWFEKQKEGAADIEALGAKPLTGVAKTAADVTGGLLKLPAQAMTGPLGFASLITEAFGSAKNDFYNKAKQEGLSDNEALDKASFNATATTAAALPLYYLGGKIAGAASDKLVSDAAPKLARVATQFGFNAVANSVASSALRGVSAALSGKSITDAMKDVDVPGVIQDMAFAAHSTVTHFQEQAAKGNAKEAARDLPDPVLEQVAQDPRYAEAVAPEVKARAESRMAQQAATENLPETSAVLETTAETERLATPEVMPEAPKFEEAPAKTITLEAVKEEAPLLAQPQEAVGKLIPADVFNKIKETIDLESSDSISDFVLSAKSREEFEAGQEVMRRGSEITKKLQRLQEEQGEGNVQISQEDLNDIAKFISERKSLLDFSPIYKSTKEIDSSQKLLENLGVSVPVLEQGAKQAQVLTPVEGVDYYSEDPAKRISAWLNTEYEGGSNWKEVGGGYFVRESESGSREILAPEGYVASYNPQDGGFIIPVELMGKDSQGRLFTERMKDAIASDPKITKEQGVIDIETEIISPKGAEVKPAEAPAEAQPVILSETKVPETSGISPVEGKPVESETAVQAEEGIAPREGEGQAEVAAPAGARVAAAAYLAPDGNIYEGKSHLKAMEKAKEEGAITQTEIDKKTPPVERNTDEFGYNVILPSGEKVTTTREAGGQIAKASGQAKKEQFDFGDKMHSNETRLDRYDEEGKRQVPPNLYNTNPTEAIKEGVSIHLDENIKDPAIKNEIYSAMSDPSKEMSETATTQFNRALQALGLTRDDLKAVGITPKGTKETQFVLDSAKDYTKWLSDVLRNIKMPHIKDAGLWENSFEHAGARHSIKFLSEDLLAKVFPDSYKNKEEMAKTGRILVFDDILGGYEKAKQERDMLRASEPEGSKRLEKAELDVAAIEASHNIPEMEAEVQSAKGTKIEENINRWSQYVVPEMDRHYNILAGVDPNTTREGRGKYFGSRVNLLAKSEEKKLAGYEDESKPRPIVDVANHKNPAVKKDPFRRKATLTGEYSYDPSLMLINSLASRVNEATKLNLYKAIEDKGVGFLAKPGEKMPEQIGGKPVGVISVTIPETNPETGKTSMVNRRLYVQKQLKPELMRVLDVDSRPEMNAFAKALNSVQVATGVDAIAHLTNQFGKTYQILSDLSGIAKNSIPLYNFLKSGKTIVDLTKEVASDSPKIREEKAQLAKMGVIRPYHPNDSLAERVLGTHDLLYKTDIAVRIFANRAFDQLVKEGKVVDRLDDRIAYVSELGNYNRRMMGEWEQMLRDKGIAPFVVAGRAFTKAGLKAATFTPGYSASTLKGKLMARASLMAAFAGTNAIVATINMMTTGRPDGRDGNPLGHIDLGPKFDTEDGKKRSIDMWKLSLVRRGLREMGGNAVIEGVKNGEDPADIWNHAKNEIATSWSHPFIGPAIGAAVQVATGKRPDLRSGYAERFETRNIGGPKQLAENLRVAIKQQVPPIYEALKPAIQTTMEEGLGIPRPSEEMVPKLKAQAEKKGVVGKVSEYTIDLLTKGLIEPVAGAVGIKATKSPAEKLASELGKGVQFSPEEDSRYAYRKAFIDLKKNGDNEGAKNILIQGIKDGFIKKADVTSIERNLSQPEALIRKVGMLKDAPSSIRVFKVASKDQQDLISDEVIRKISGSSTLDENDRAKLMLSVLTSAKKGSLINATSSKFPKEALHKLAYGIINQDEQSIKDAVAMKAAKK